MSPDDAVIAYLQTHGRASAPDLARLLGVHTRPATRRLERLARAGYVVRDAVPLAERPAPRDASPRYLWRLRGERDTYAPPRSSYPCVRVPHRLYAELAPVAAAKGRPVSWVAQRAWILARAQIRALER